jgi:hypothetical protein
LISPALDLIALPLDLIAPALDLITPALYLIAPDLELIADHVASFDVATAVVPVGSGFFWAFFSVKMFLGFFLEWHPHFCVAIL